MADTRKLATLINSAGKMIKVDTQADKIGIAKLMGQGYQLMGAGGKYVAPTTDALTPADKSGYTPGPAETATVVDPKTGELVPGPGVPKPVTTTPTAATTYQPVTYVNPATGKRVKVTSMEQQMSLEKEGYGLEGKTQGKLAVEKMTDVNGATTRAGVEALGYTYLGTLEAKDQAIREGNDVVLVGEKDYYIKGKPTVQTTEEKRAEETITKPGGEVIDTTGWSEAEKMAGKKEPTSPNMLQSWEDLRNKRGVDDLEAGLNAAYDKLGKLDDAYLAGQHQVEGELGPMQILEGRSNKLQQQYNEQRSIAVREIESAQRRVDSANAVITTIMNLTQTDYQNARQEYKDSFTMNLQTQQYLQGVQQQAFENTLALSAEERAKKAAESALVNAERDDARANLNTLINSFTTSGKGWNDITPAMKASVKALEVQAGLPAGSMEAFVRAKPKANILATVNGTDSSGNDIVTFVYADENGNPGQVTTLKTGGYTASKTTTTTGVGGTELATNDINSYASMIMAGRLSTSDVSQKDRLAVTQVVDQIKSTPIGKEIASYMSKLGAGAMYDTAGKELTRDTVINNILTKYYSAAEQKDQAIINEVSNTVYSFIPDEIETGLKEKIMNKNSSGKTAIPLSDGTFIYI